MEKENTLMRDYVGFVSSDEFCRSYDKGAEEEAKIWSDILDAVYQLYEND